MIKLAIIGTGNMAGQQAREFAKLSRVRITACCDIDAARAQAFAAEHQIAHAYSSVRALLAAEQLDAVSVVTPDAAHKPVVLAALRRGLHVLCEKPLAVNARDAKQMLDAARRAGVINMVNFSYRNAAALQKARTLAASGALGRILHVEASYLQSWLARLLDAQEIRPGALWRLSTAMGSNGTLGDLGVHIVDFATSVAGAITHVGGQLATFSKGAFGSKYRGVTLDANDSCMLSARFANGALGVIHSTRWGAGHNNSLLLRVFGDRGALEVDLDRSWGELRVCIGRKNLAAHAWETLRCPATPNIYQRFARSIASGRNDQPDFETGWNVQRCLDACRRSARTGRIEKV